MEQNQMQGRHLGTCLWHILQFRCTAVITALRHPLLSYSWYTNYFPDFMSLEFLRNSHTRPPKTISKIRRHGPCCFHLACEFCCPFLKETAFLWCKLFMTGLCLLLFFYLSCKYFLMLVYFPYSIYYYFMEPKLIRMQVCPPMFIFF